MTPPPIHGLCPLIQVFDMPRSLTFYRDQLGFDVVQQAPSVGDQCDWAWLRRGSAELMLNTMYEAPHRPATPNADRVTAHGDTALFIGAPDVEAMYAWLVARGIAAEEPVVQGYGMRQLYLKDPDGYTICFQWPAT